MRRLVAFVHNTLFYVILVGYLVSFVFLLAAPGPWSVVVGKNLHRNLIRFQKLFGMKIEVRGFENVPKEGCIIASKHQSMWETFALFAIVEKPVFIYKSELDKIPLFGHFLRKLGMISVDRGGGAAALKDMAERSRREIDKGFEVLIFPEGTRKPPGAAPAYKYGIAKMYEEIQRPVVPLVLNSGLFWSSYFWRGYRGRIVVEFLPSIAPGMERDAFFQHLQATMEAASDKLLLESAARPDAPPLGEAAKARIAALTGGV
jgi:1-acyl-sn-glycerol-3-phosphate acyltransferase